MTQASTSTLTLQLRMSPAVQAALADLTALSGRLQLLPEHALGDLQRRLDGLLLELRLGEIVPAGEARNDLCVEFDLHGIEDFLAAAHRAVEGVAVVQGDPHA